MASDPNLAARIAMAGLLAVLAACSSQAAAPGDTQQVTVASVAAAQHVTGLTRESPELYVRAQARGVRQGTPVRVYVFAQEADKTTWEQAANEFGGFTVVVQGPRFLVVAGP
jgi:hypothetical protein